MHAVLRTLTAGLWLSAGMAQAAPIDWNTWASNSAGTITSGASTISVGYASADSHNLVAGYPSWTPVSTWADGVVVDNAPLPANGIMQIFGGSATVNTITFSTPVLNPVVAIWSLGQPGLAASFVFDQSPTFVAGGPNAQYGGGSIGVVGNTVTEVEGNGTVQFLGTFSSLTFTNPQFESWYGFNVGIAGAVPEPAAALLALPGLLVVGLAVRRRRA